MKDCAALSWLSFAQLKVYLVIFTPAVTLMGLRLGHQIEFSRSKLNWSYFPVKIQDGMENIIRRLEKWNNSNVWSHEKCLCWLTDSLCFIRSDNFSGLVWNWHRKRQQLRLSSFWIIKNTYLHNITNASIQHAAVHLNRVQLCLYIIRWWHASAEDD